LQIQIREWDKVRHFLSLSDKKTKQEDGTNLSLDQIQRAVFEKDEDNNTALHFACKLHASASEDVIKMLVDIGGKELVLAKDKDNWTASHSTCSNGASVDVIKILVDIWGMELVMAKDEYSKTALHFACELYASESVDVIKMLVDIGGKELVLAKEKDNKTALHVTCECYAWAEACLVEVIDVLVKSGVSSPVLFTAEANHGDEVYLPIHFLMEYKVENKEVIPIKAILHLQLIW
jgi:predicted transcriptional regulator